MRRFCAMLNNGSVVKFCILWSPEGEITVYTADESLIGKNSCQVGRLYHAVLIGFFCHGNSIYNKKSWTKIIQECCEAMLNKSWRQHPTKHQLYGHLPPITKTIQVRWTRHAGHCWRSRDELIRDVLRWIPTYGWSKAGRPAQTYKQQLCEDTECSPDDMPEAMKDREKWRERVRHIRARATTWWWWSLSLSLYIYI